MAFFRITKILLIACLLLAVLADSQSSSGSSKRSKRAIGGRRFSRGVWPWLSLMRATIVTRRLFGFFPISHYHLYCGGALVSDRWLISAAHCFAEFGRHARRASNWEARLATNRLRAGIREHVLDIIGRVFDSDELRLWDVDVERLIIHPNYNRSGIYSDDIAMVKLSRPVPSSRRFSFIQAIALPSPDEPDFPTIGEQCITKGWGCTSRGGGPSHQANQISMPIHDPARCNHHYNINMNKRICAGHENSGVGVCPGDSGSPLVCQRGGTYQLAGIVSLTSSDNPESFPAVFTSVKDYVPWIRSVMRQN